MERNAHVLLGHPMILLMSYTWTYRNLYKIFYLVSYKMKALQIKLYCTMHACVGNWSSVTEPRAENVNLCDVWDGAALRPLREPGRFFSDINHIALGLSTDGVPIYKSSKVSIWPVYLSIFNLPPSVRMNSENIILCGLWVGPSKPLMNLLLEPISSYLLQLSSKGINIKLESGESTVRA